MKIITTYPIIHNHKEIINPYYDTDYLSLDAEKNGLTVFTTYPIILNDKIESPSDYYLNADGEEYLPFNGETKLETFLDETGEQFYLSADGETFFNAKGEKVKGLFKKVGKGVVKVGKAIGKVAKKVARAVAKASKNVAKGVKKAGGKVKTGAKNLIHHKKKSSSGEKSSSNNSLSKVGNKGAKGSEAKQPTDETKEQDVFTKPLEKATPETPKDKIVTVGNQQFSTEGIEKGKEIVETISEEGNSIAGVEYKPEEVVAVEGSDGNIKYYTPEQTGGMSKGMKNGLIVGGAVLVLGIVGFIIYKSIKKQ